MVIVTLQDEPKSTYPIIVQDVPNIYLPNYCTGCLKHIPAQSLYRMSQIYLPNHCTGCPKHLPTQSLYRMSQTSTCLIILQCSKIYLHNYSTIHPTISSSHHSTGCHNASYLATIGCPTNLPTLSEYMLTLLLQISTSLEVGIPQSISTFREVGNPPIHYTNTSWQVAKFTNS